MKDWHICYQNRSGGKTDSRAWNYHSFWIFMGYCFKLCGSLVLYPFPVEQLQMSLSESQNDQSKDLERYRNTAPNYIILLSFGVYYLLIHSFWDSIPLCRPGWSATLYVSKADLNSEMLELKTFITMPE